MPPPTKIVNGKTVIDGPFIKSCDLCSLPCKDCKGDKFNCTLCDHKSDSPALFTQVLSIRGKTQTRGTCYKTCPNGYFIDKTNPLDIRCGACASPCASCEKSAD